MSNNGEDAGCGFLFLLLLIAFILSLGDPSIFDVLQALLSRAHVAVQGASP